MSATPQTHNEALAQTAADVDPTRTKTLRRRYAQKLRGGFARVVTPMREGVAENDIFGLKKSRRESLVAPPDNRVFRFSAEAERIDAFEEWLSNAHQEEVLSIISKDGNEFVRSAYGRGIKHADARLKEAGIDVPDEDLRQVFNKPIHRDKLQTLFVKDFRALEGVTDAVEKETTRIIAEGLTEGVNPNEMARRITDRVDKIGKTRATTLARTSVIDAHAEATLNRYDRMGVEEVGAKVEFQTAGDTRVCPICASLEGTTLKVAEARGMIPQHPRCRCAWLPVTN
jgi:SPP1 gp7 family putative phage head morphogenesis protein